MDVTTLCEELVEKKGGKILLVIMDGVGDLPDPGTNLTPLEAAKTPCLDSIAPASSMGLAYAIGRGITPGSGPAHMSLFGYDPVKYMVERGALSAAGVDFPMEEGDIAARANFATIDADGNVTDRRAGRIPTEKCVELTTMLAEKISIDGVEVFVKPEKEHRAAVIFRGAGLSEAVCDTDPQATGVAPVEPAATSDNADAEKMAGAIHVRRAHMGDVSGQKVGLTQSSARDVSGDEVRMLRSAARSVRSHEVSATMSAALQVDADRVQLRMSAVAVTEYSPRSSPSTVKFPFASVRQVASGLIHEVRSTFVFFARTLTMAS